MRDVNLIVIHCSASKSGASLTRGDARAKTLRSAAQTIDAWHVQAGFHRQDAWRKALNPGLAACGYHYVIDTNGSTESGRHLDEIGAHAAPHNANSIGICMVGMGQYTAAQWAALANIVRAMLLRYPGARVLGHRDLSPDRNRDGRITPDEWIKTCPVFDVSDWIARDMKPAPEHIFKEVV